jgi:hypothetical protein
MFKCGNRGHKAGQEGAVLAGRVEVGKGEVEVDEW